MKIYQSLLLTVLCCLFNQAAVHAQCITLEATVSPVICHNNTNGAIDVTVTSGTGPFTYQWSNGADTEDLSDVPAGMYIITVTDAFGCNVSLARTLTNPPAIVDSLGGFCESGFTPMDLTCYVSGGVAPYQYLWSTGELTSVIQVQSPPANYSVTITDVLGCQSFQSIFSGPPRALVQNATVNIECINPSIVLSGAGSQYDLNHVSIFWDSPGPEEANIVSGGNTIFPTVNGPGTYYLNIFDSVTLCASFNVVTVTSTGPNAFLNADAGQDQSISCINGSATLNGSQSSSGPNIVYQWTTTDGNIVSGASSPSPTVNMPGTYTLTVSNSANGCTASDQVLVIAPPLPIANAGPDLGLPCGGGSVTLAAVTSGPNMSYFWIGGPNISNQFLLNPIVNTAGIYTLIVTDAANGCTATDQMEVFDGPIIAAQNIAAQDLPCQPGALGGIDLTVNFGTGPYTFLWSNNVTTEDLDNLLPGTYSVTVTDNTVCNFYGFATVGQSVNFVQTSFVTTDPGCAAGAIDLTATNPTPPYAYAWSGPNNFSSTLEDPNGLGAGVYVVTITDATSCTATASVTLHPGADAPTLSFTTTTAICETNGMIDLTVSGGTSPYTYDWSNDGPDAIDDDPEDLTGLSAGSYTVTVTDALGCETASTPITMTATPLLTLSGVITPSACGPNNNTGAVDLTVSGGAPPFQYAWGNGVPTQDINMLSSGNIFVWVTDANNCTVDTFFTIPRGSVIPAGDFTVSPASCEPGAADGAITLNTIPPTAQAPLNFAWSGPSGFSSSQQNPTNLMEGVYTLSLTDGTGCTYSAEVTVGKVPGNFTLSTAVTDASCNGGSDGAIDLTVSGGVGPFDYLWSSGITFQNLVGIPAGVYTVTVTENSGCSKTATATVGQLNGFDGNISVTNVFCFNGTNGSLTASGIGGQTPYSFIWSNGATTSAITNLAAGSYTVTISDINGCFVIKTAQITQPTAIDASTMVTNVACFGGNTGSVDLTVFGGVPPYTYDWVGPQGISSTTQDLTNLIAGNYTVTITDANFCLKILTVQVGSSTACNIPANNIQITNVRCHGGSDGAINITPIGGTPPYTYDWSNDGPEDPDNDPEDIGNLPAGTYNLTITDSRGCTVVIPGGFTISEPVALAVQINELSNTCDVAVLQAGVAGGVGAYTFQWSGPNGFTSTAGQQITAPFSGTYTVTVTDVNGCSVTGSKTVQLAGNGACGYIRGVVVHDILENCVVENGEPGLGGWLVRAEGADTLYGITDQNGRYLVSVPAGDYTMVVIAPNNLWDICPLSQTVSLINAGDTIQGGDFPVQSPFDCALLSVSIGTNQLRRCFANNFYYVEYCNEGAAVAEDAYVIVSLDPFLDFQNASIPHQALGGNQYRFNVGDLDVGECGMFNIRVIVSCSAVLGQTHCTEAQIFPDTLCNTNALWSGASLSLRSECAADSLRFVVKNIGGGNILGALDYIVVEDAVMRMSAPMPDLAPGDSVQISVPANGSTWRLEVDQELYHPYPDPISLSVEGCTTSAAFSTGYVNQFPLGDEPPATDEDCTANIGSYDPNDKHGYPIGYGAERFIRPGTDLEYLIRFQNTGTDTAFNIVVLDTLSALLDPATIKFGAASHPYRYDLTGSGIVHFYFDNIMLPDSFVNEVASHGFVKFSIEPRADAPLGETISNTAAIYFDFNDPIITNTTTHKLGVNFITVRSWQPLIPGAEVSVSPNPFSESTYLTVKGLKSQAPLQLQVIDLYGKVLGLYESSDGRFEVRKNNWPSGTYLFSLRQNGKMVGSGKLMVE